MSVPVPAQAGELSLEEHIPAPADTERAFRRWVRQHTATRTRTVLRCGIAVVLAVCLLDLVLLPQIALITVPLRLATMVPILVGLLAVIERPRLEAVRDAIFCGGAVLFGWCAIAIGAAAMLHGGPNVYLPGLLLTVISAYQFIALPFRLACCIALTISLTFAVVTLIAVDPTPLLAYQYFFLAATNLIGAFECYAFEQANRREFRRICDLQQDAARDPVTGIANRQALDRHVDTLWADARRRRTGMAVLLIDIDHFKAYNDRYGHQAGDACLRRVAAQVRRYARRPLDLAARYGGEEFAVILADATHEYLVTLAQQICRGVAELAIPHEGAACGHVTVSIGATCIRPGTDCDTAANAIRLADQALYEAKDQGRNRCVFRFPGLA